MSNVNEMIAGKHYFLTSMIYESTFIDSVAKIIIGDIISNNTTSFIYVPLDTFTKQIEKMHAMVKKEKRKDINREMLGAVISTLQNGYASAIIDEVQTGEEFYKLFVIGMSGLLSEFFTGLNVLTDFRLLLLQGLVEIVDPLLLTNSQHRGLTSLSSIMGEDHVAKESKI